MLDNISSAYNVMQSSFQQGKLQSVDEQNNLTRQHFLVSLHALIATAVQTLILLLFEGLVLTGFIFSMSLQP